MNIIQLLDIAIQAAVLAGEKILYIYNSKEFNIEYKNDQSPLTQADKDAHDTIVELLNKTNIPILSEEGKHLNYNKRKNWEYLWIVDPLDGTKEFIKENGEFTVNIALIKKSKTILGVIYAPVLKELYFNEDPENAFIVEHIQSNWNKDKLLKFVYENKIKLSVKTGKQYRLVASRSHLSKETKLYMERLKEKINNIEIVNIGSSLKLCLLAAGQADIYPRFAPTMEWDIAAGHAILKAAGGDVVNYENGKELEYNKENLLNPWFIAGNKILLEQKNDKK